MGNEATRIIGKDLVTLDQAVRMVAQERIGHQDWSGLPLPVPGLSLVLEPRYKHPGIADFRWKECYDEHGARSAAGRVAAVPALRIPESQLLVE